MEEISYDNEESIAKILDRAVQLFRRTGLDELAVKSEKILRNYVNAINLR